MESESVAGRVAAREFVFCLLVLIGSFVTANLGIGSGVLDDPFHHGEFFAAYSSLRSNVDFFPLAIHGGMDFFPAYIAHWLSAEEYYVYLTRIIYLVLQFFACVMMLLLLVIHVKNLIISVAAAFLIPYFIGYRDFSIVILLFTFFFVTKYSLKNKKTGLFVLLGVIGALNFIFSSNRGVFGTVAIGAGVFAWCFYDRRYIFSIIAYVLGVASVIYVSFFWIKFNPVENILYFKETTAQWEYSDTGYTVLLKSWVALAIFLSYSLNIIQFKLCGSQKRDIPNLIVLGLLSIFYYQIASYRADYFHLIMSFTILLLNVFYWLSRHEYYASKSSFQENIVLILLFILAMLSSKFGAHTSTPLSFVILYAFLIGNNLDFWKLVIQKNAKYVTVILFLVFSSLLVRSISKNYNNGDYAWLANSPTKTSNSSIVNDSMNWISNQLVSRGASCVFDLSNNGLINAVTGLPACTRFSYLVYASAEDQSEIIRALENDKPKAVVYSTSFWSYSIDGKPMNERFPVLDNYLVSAYKQQTCDFGYCIRHN